MGDGASHMRSQAEGHAFGSAADLVQVVVQVHHRRLQVLVAEEELDLADVQAALKPASRGEATEAVQPVAVAALLLPPPPKSTATARFMDSPG